MEEENHVELDYIQFGLLSKEEILRQSVCEVSSIKLTGNDSVYDERMGILEGKKVCTTCSHTEKTCVGHFGHITLNVCIIHPLFYKLTISILKCVCRSCSRILLNKKQLEIHGLLKYTKNMRFVKILEKMERIDVCKSCHKEHPKYIFSSQEKNIYYIERNMMERIRMTETELLTIFSRMKNEDVELLGFDLRHFHPKNLILEVLPVLPPIARPFVITENVTCDDDLTLQYIEIIKSNNYLASSSIPDVKRQKYIHTLKFKIKSLFDNSGERQKVNNGRPLKGIKKRLTGKEGIIRNNLMGKRVDKSARTVIGPDPTLCIDEIGIPIEIADTLCYSVRVNHLNKEELMRKIDTNQAKFILRNNNKTRINLKYASMTQGTRLYYGDLVKKRCGKWIHVVSDKMLFSLEDGDEIYRFGRKLEDIQPVMKKNVELQIGDIVERKLQDGDVLLLNRQPTLHKGSMIAFKIKIIPGKTIRMNLATTSTFNADFDGDEMNLHCPASVETEAELRFLSSIENHLVNSQSSKANIYVVQDGILAIYMMTLSKQPRWLSREEFFHVLSIFPDLSIQRFQKKQAFFLTRNNNHHINKTHHYHGRLLFSMLLPDDFYYTHTNKACKDEPTVVIENGVLLTGCITKANIGSSHSSIILSLYHTYGTETCVKFINQVQFIANQYIQLVGFSVSIRDCIISKTNDIQSRIDQSFLKARQAVESMTNDTIKEMYISIAMGGARDMGMAIAKNSLDETNSFVRTVTSGAKGDYFNISQIAGLLGQQMLNGKRIPLCLSGGVRSLPHYPLDKKDYSDDLLFESQGFIRRSFLKGLSPREFYLHSMTGREGITDTAMKTATSGYIQRRMVKIAEDIQVKYDGTVRNSQNAIIQFMYGIDPSKGILRNNDLLSCDVSRTIQSLNHLFSSSTKH